MKRIVLTDDEAALLADILTRSQFTGTISTLPATLGLVVSVLEKIKGRSKPTRPQMVQPASQEPHATQ